MGFLNMLSLENYLNISKWVGVISAKTLRICSFTECEELFGNYKKQTQFLISIFLRGCKV